MFLLNGQPLQIDTPFTVGVEEELIQYPANWIRLSTKEDLEAIGITEVADEAVQYDDRFYWSAGNPKDLEQLKKQHIAQAKDAAGKMLAATDWMVIRKIERSVEVPAEVSDERAAIVKAVNDAEVAMNAAKTVEELIPAVQVAWPVKGE
jgi:hypothetical protein